MRLRIAVAALAMAAASLVVGAGAASADPPVPAGCSFDQGVLTCSTSTTVTETYGPFTTPGNGFVPVSTMFGPVSGLTVCQYLGSNGPWIIVRNLTYSVDVTTTTTTQRHGLRGKIFESSPSESIGNLRVPLTSYIECSS